MDFHPIGVSILAFIEQQYNIINSNSNSSIQRNGSINYFTRINIPLRTYLIHEPSPITSWSAISTQFKIK